MNNNQNPNNRQAAAFQELLQAMNQKSVYLKRAMDILAEHYNGVVILVHCYDAETQAAVTASKTYGDPLAAQQLAQKFVSEQALTEQHNHMHRLNSLRNPPDENSSSLG